MAEEGVKVRSMPLDDLSRLITEKYESARDYRVAQETLWRSAYDAYSAKYPTSLSHSNELAEERGIYINLTRRKVQNASIRITSMLLNDGKIPFTVKPSRKPRYLPPDLEGEDPIEELHNRALNMEKRIRDILDATDYSQTLHDVVFEMCLYGTGVIKSVSLERLNYPVYRSVRTDVGVEEVESQIEEEIIPTANFVSCWNIFPSPECTSFRDAEYVIQRSFLSAIDLRKLAGQGEGFFKEQIFEALKEDKGRNRGEDQSEHPYRVEESRSADRQKGFEVLEFWGKLDAKDLGPYLDIDEDDMTGMIDVVITCLGDKVIRIAENPFDGQIPFYSCTWQRSPERVWGDGIWYSVRDIQSVMNFSYAMMIEGKHLSSVPMTVIDPSAFEAGEDTERVQAGKQYRAKPGVDVNSAFKPVIIPDVTQGLVPLIQMLQQESDLDTGLAPIGLGQDSPYQTRTATGMSLLNTNANRQTASVVRSVSNMISGSITAIYRWLMVDSEDTSIKGDFEAVCQGYERYVADEIHNTQLLSFLQVAGQSPQLQNFFNFEQLARPLARAFNMEPELVVKTQEQVQQEQQSAMQSQQQQMQEQVQMQLQLEQGKAQIEAELESLKKLLEEKQKVSDDERESEIKERLELIKQGNVLKPSQIGSMSILIGEEEEAQEQAQQQQMMQMMQEEQAMQAQQGMMPEQEMMNQRQAGNIGNIIDQRVGREQEMREGGPNADALMRRAG